MKTHLVPFLLATSAFLLGTPALQAELPQYDRPPELLENKLPMFPTRLQLEGILQGEVETLVDIDAQGRVVDVLYLGATHRYFVDAVDRVIHDWRFSPALREGEPAPTTKSLTIEFKLGELVNASFGPSIAFADLEAVVPNRGVEAYIAKMSELDRIPTPRSIVRPGIFAEIPEDERTGRAVFQFFIDEQGAVRIPVLTEVEGDLRLAEAALIALEQWQFEPPRVHGRPVITHARQEFLFQNEE